MRKKMVDGKKVGRRLLGVVLSLLMCVGLVTIATAARGADGLATEEPVLVVTGQGLPGGAVGSAENVTNERAYTIEELQALGELSVERLYSSINRAETKIFYRGQGVDLEGLLALSGYTDKGRVNIVASDGYSSAFNMGDERYFYPNFADGDESGAEAIKAILAWRSADNQDTPPVQPEPFPKNDDADENSLRLLAGQLNVEDVNSNLYSRNVNTVRIGDAIEDSMITVLGAELTRAEILLMPRADRAFQFTTQAGERTDTVRGVPLAELLKDVADNTMIKFETVDNWARASEYTMTKGELVTKNAILAYEIKDGDDWSGYCRETDEGFGYFRLMVDGESGVHAVNVVGMESLAAEPEDAPSYNQDEVYAAVDAGLVPDSVALAGWKNNTSRLAAAEAMVLLIEKASGKTMEDIANENSWDLTTGGFDDTDSQDVTFLKYAKVVDGMGDNKYGPDSIFSRAQAVTMIGRAAEAFFDIDVKGDNPFTDVPDWAAPFVGYAAESGITLGVGGGLFNPSGDLQNQQTALFIIRAYNAWN